MAVGGFSLVLAVLTYCRLQIDVKRHQGVGSGNEFEEVWGNLEV